MHACGCMLNHSSQCFTGYICDPYGIFLLLWSMGAYSCFRAYLWNINGWVQMVTVFGVTCCGMAFIFAFRGGTFGCFYFITWHFILAGCLIIAGIWRNLLTLPKSFYEFTQSFWYTILIFGVAAIFQVLDRAGNPLCKPEAFPPFGHALWHLLTAYSLLQAYKILRQPRKDILPTEEEVPNEADIEVAEADKPVIRVPAAEAEAGPADAAGEADADGEPEPG